jgi:hypothetical protein
MNVAIVVQRSVHRFSYRTLSLSSASFSFPHSAKMRSLRLNNTISNISYSLHRTTALRRIISFLHAKPHAFLARERACSTSSTSSTSNVIRRSFMVRIVVSRNLTYESVHARPQPFALPPPPTLSQKHTLNCWSNPSGLVSSWA